ncbi:MAG: hypothetical protein WC307_04885 [Candidatus Nanoarchaeia archaeon]
MVLQSDCQGCGKTFSINDSEQQRQTENQSKWSGVTTCKNCKKLILYHVSRGSIASSSIIDRYDKSFTQTTVVKSGSKNYNITPEFLEGLDIKGGSLQRVNHEGINYFVFLNDDSTIKSFANENQLLNEFKLRNFIDQGDEPIKRDNWTDYNDYFLELSKGLDSDLTTRRVRVAKTKKLQIKSLETELRKINKASNEIKSDLDELKKSYAFVKSFQDKSEPLIEIKQLIDDYSKYYLYQLLTDEQACEHLNIKSTRVLIDTLSAYADYNPDNFNKLRCIASAEKGNNLSNVMRFLESTIGLLTKFKNEKKTISTVINEYSQKGFNEFVVQDWTIESKINKSVTNEVGQGDALISIIEKRRDSLIEQVTNELTSKVDDLKEPFIKATEKIANIEDKAIGLWKSINDKRKKEISSLYDNIGLMPELITCEPSAIDELFNPLIKQINHYLNNPNELPELKNDFDYLKEHDPEFILERVNLLDNKARGLEARIKNGFKNELIKRSFKPNETEQLKKEISDIESLTLKYDFITNHYDQYVSGYIDFRMMDTPMTLDYDVPKEFLLELNEHIISELKTRFPNKINAKQLETFKNIIKGQKEDYNISLDNQFKVYGNKEPAIQNCVDKLTKSINKLGQIIIKEELDLWQSGHDRRSADELKKSLSDKLGGFYNDELLTNLNKELDNLWTDIGLADKTIITTELDSLRNKVIDVKKLTTKSKKEVDENKKDGYSIINLVDSPNLFLFFNKPQTKTTMNKAVDELRDKIANKLSSNYSLFKVDENYSALNIEVFGKDSECDFVQQAVEGLNYNSYNNICALQELVTDYYTDCQARGVKPHLKEFIESNADEFALKNIKLPPIKALKKEFKNESGLSAKISELMAKYDNKTKRFNKIKNIAAVTAITAIAGYVGIPPEIIPFAGAAWKLFDNYAGMKEIDLEGYEQSVINGDVAEAIDMVRTAYGPDTTVYQQLFDPSNPLINQEYVNEIEAGIDVDGDSQLTEHALNFWYDAPGDPATDGDIWSADQENGIAMYQDHTLAEQFRQGFYDSLFKVMISGAGLLLSAYLLKKQIGDKKSIRDYNLIRTIPDEYNHVALRFTKGSKRSLESSTI